MEKKRVIIVTDGDDCAKAAVERAAANLGLRCISASGGNPTPLSGREIVDLVMTAASDTVLVMVDDRGKRGTGLGERALKEIYEDERVDVIGAVAVASDTSHVKGAEVSVSVTGDGRVVDGAVDKNGVPNDGDRRIKGDTVDILESLDIPVVIGIGDIGKMDGADEVEYGARITTKAIEEILNRYK